MPDGFHVIRPGAIDQDVHFLEADITGDRRRKLRKLGKEENGKPQKQHRQEVELVLSHLFGLNRGPAFTGRTAKGSFGAGPVLAIVQSVAPSNFLKNNLIGPVTQCFVRSKRESGVWQALGLTSVKVSRQRTGRVSRCFLGKRSVFAQNYGTLQVRTGISKLTL